MAEPPPSLPPSRKGIALETLQETRQSQKLNAKTAPAAGLASEELDDVKVPKTTLGPGLQKEVPEEILDPFRAPLPVQ